MLTVSNIVFKLHFLLCTLPLKSIESCYVTHEEQHLWNHSSVPLKTHGASLAFSIDFRIIIDASKIFFMSSYRLGLSATSSTAAFCVALECISVGLFGNVVN